MEEYIKQRQNMSVQYIATQSLLEIFEGSERVPGAQVGMRWWEQVELDIVGTREVAASTAEGDGGE